MWVLPPQASGISIIITCGKERPLSVSNSTTLSRLAESDWVGSQIGRIISSSSRLKYWEVKAASAAAIQLVLPFTVLISPLWAMYRKGCASRKDGKVLVEKRECTTARADTTFLCC